MSYEFRKKSNEFNLRYGALKFNESRKTGKKLSEEAFINSDPELHSLHAKLEDARKQIRESELQKRNSQETKKTAKQEIKINAGVAVQYSLASATNILSLSKLIVTLKNSATATVIDKLGIAVAALTLPISALALAISAVFIYKDKKNIASSKKVIASTKELQIALSEKRKLSATNGNRVSPVNEGISSEKKEIQKATEELASILKCVQAKQVIKVKKVSLLINIITFGGYAVLAASGSLALAIAVGSSAALVSAAAIVSPIGWGIAGFAAVAGLAFTLYKCVRWKQHRTEKRELVKQLDSDDEKARRDADLKLLKTSSSHAVDRLLELVQHNDEGIRSAAKSVLSQFVKERGVINTLSHDAESIKFISRKLNMKARPKKPSIETMPFNNLYTSSV